MGERYSSHEIQHKDKGKRKMVEGWSSPYPKEESKPKLFADAQECIFNRPSKRAKTHGQGASPSYQGAYSQNLFCSSLQNSAQMVAKFAHTYNDNGKRKRIEACPSAYPTKEPQHKVIANAQKCIFNPPWKRAKTHNQASSSQISASRPPPGFAARDRPPPPPGFNLRERNDRTFEMKSASSSFQGALGLTQNLICSSKQNSTKVVVKFAQTLPYCHLQIPPWMVPHMQLLLLNLFLLTIHGLWGLNDEKKAEDQNLPKDEKDIKEEVASSIYDIWPSLKNPSKKKAQKFWSYEWEHHGRKMGLFRNKEEYVKEAERLYYEFDISWFLSIAVAILRSLDSQDLVETTYNGVHWFGVRASRLHRILSSGIGEGVIFKCKRDESKYLLLREVFIVLEYDRRTMAHEVVSYRACSRSQSWRYMRAFGGRDIIWFVTKESNKQVQSQGIS